MFSFRVRLFESYLRNLGQYNSHKYILLCYLVEAVSFNLSPLYLPSAWSWFSCDRGRSSSTVMFDGPFNHHPSLTALHVTLSQSSDCLPVGLFLDSIPGVTVYP